MKLREKESLLLVYSGVVLRDVIPRDELRLVEVRDSHGSVQQWGCLADQTIFNTPSLPLPPSALSHNSLVIVITAIKAMVSCNLYRVII